MSTAKYNKLKSIIEEFIKFDRLFNLIIDNSLKRITPRLLAAEKKIDDLKILKGELRPCLLTEFLIKDLKKLKISSIPIRISNIEKYLDDLDICYPFITNESSQQSFGLYKVIRDSDLKNEFGKNFSTGLKQNYRRLKAYLANNHLLAMFLRNPETFTGDAINYAKRMEKYGFSLDEAKTVRVALENQARESTKIDDLYITLTTPNFKINVNGKAIDLSDIMAFVRITTDSKFFKDAYRIADGKKLFQQSALYLGDRVSQLGEVIKVLKNKNLTEDEIVQLVADIIPMMFIHYVVIPKDKNVTSNTLKKYVKTMKHDFTDYFNEIDKFLQLSPELKERILKVMDDHIDTHFGSGNFVKKHEINYADIE